MILSRIELYNFRSHTSASFSLDPHLTVVVGKNGVGKTNLLEAIYILFRGTSFRAIDGELVSFDAPWWRVVGEVDGTVRELRYQPDKVPAKQLKIHETTKRFMTKDRLPVVLFEPNDLLLIHGSPSRRRAALDDMLSGLSPTYKQALSRYERALRQRNNLLKKFGSHPELSDMLFVWDVALAKYGETIVTEREGLVAKLNRGIPTQYSRIAGRASDVALHYTATTPSTSSSFIEKLHKNLALDRVRTITSVGPHRDDFHFSLNQTDAKISASRGEVRSLLLGMKLAYTSLLHEAYETEPVILLDDVFSELDSDRQQNLLTTLAHNQVIITDTKVVSNDGKHIQL